MFTNTISRDQFRPPNNVLAQCECVRIERDNRPGWRAKLLRDWAQEYCNSLVWWELEGWDDEHPVDRPEVWFYYFYKPEDATAFRLKWL